MKLQLDNPVGQNIITGYGDDYVLINQQRYEKSLIVTPDRLIPDWGPGSIAELAASHLEFLVGLSPEIVLLGTGRSLAFPPPALMRCLSQSNIGLEIMDNGAACRTYTILMAERRNVLAALLVG